jgi:hypothetical protein
MSQPRHAEQEDGGEKYQQQLRQGQTRHTIHLRASLDVTVTVTGASVLVESARTNTFTIQKVNAVY